MALDIHNELVQQISDDVTQAVVGDARDKEVLRALDAKSFDCGIVAIGDSLGNSVLATMNLKELGVPYVVCKAHDETHKEVLKKLGADGQKAWVQPMFWITLSFLRTTVLLKHRRRISGLIRV